MLWKWLGWWLFVAGLLLGRANAEEGIVLYADGLRLGDDRIWRAGEIVDLGGVSLRLEGSGRQEYFTGEKRGRIHRLESNGARTLVGCAISNERVGEYSAGHREPLNPLENLSDAEVRFIQGVEIRVWSPAIKQALARLDWSRTCLRVALDVMRDTELPDLPEGTRLLVVTQYVSGRSIGYRNLRPLASLRLLEHLDLGGTSWQGEEPLDLAPLGDLPLRHLTLPWARKAKNQEVLGGLKQLQDLNVSGAQYLGEMRWLSGLTSLRRFRATGLGRYAENFVPPQLEALAGLKQLETLELASAQVDTLPQVELPALRRAVLLKARIPPAQVEAFRRANPRCEILDGLNATLQRELAKADRLLVRTGGVCHRRRDEEKTIVESRDPKQIAEVAAALRVLEDGDSLHCMCCGRPTFEFYRGDAMVAMIGFHHGRSIRWADGVWPSDGLLDRTSAKFLVHWLAERGERGPQGELGEQEAAEQAQLRLVRRYESAFPPGLHADLAASETLELASAKLEKQLPRPVERARVLLRAYGCDRNEWNRTSGWDEALRERWLKTLAPAALRQAVAEVPAGSDEEVGAARWIFGDRRTKEWKAEPALLARLARGSLQDPRPYNRRLVLAALAEMRNGDGTAVLRDCLRRKFRPGALPPEEEASAGGRVTFHPGDARFPAGMADAAIAAAYLEKLRDRDTAAEIRRLRESLSKEEAAAFTAFLSGKPPAETE